MSELAFSSKGWLDGTCNSMGFTMGFILLTDMWKYPRPLMILLAVLITGFHLARFFRLYYYFATDPINVGKIMDFPIFLTRGVIFTLIAYLQTGRLMRSMGPADPNVRNRWTKFTISIILTIGIGYTAFMGTYSGTALLVASCKRNYYRYSYCVPVAKSLDSLTNFYFAFEILLTSFLFLLDLHFMYVVVKSIFVRREVATMKKAIFSLSSKRFVLLLTAFIPFFASIMNIAHVGDYLTGVYTYRGGGYSFEISFLTLSVHILGLEFAIISTAEPAVHNINDPSNKPNFSNAFKVKKSEELESNFKG